jgi:hypothetical protein
MKKNVFVLLFVALAASIASKAQAQNLQVLYDTERGCVTSTIEMFRPDAFGEGDFNEAVVNYLIDFAEDIKCIKDIRNPADHGLVVNRSHAEFCSDVLIKVYKIFTEFLDKIGPEYIEKSLSTPQGVVKITIK